MLAVISHLGRSIFDRHLLVSAVQRPFQIHGFTTATLPVAWLLVGVLVDIALLVDPSIVLPRDTEQVLVETWIVVLGQHWHLHRNLNQSCPPASSSGTTHDFHEVI